MSQAGGKKGGPKGSKKGSDDASDRATPASIKTIAEPDAKDDPVAEGADKKDAKADENAPKPLSAGQTQRDASTRVLNLALKQEWTPVEQTLKAMEKAIAAGGEDVNTTPLAGVMDPVSG